MNICQDKAKDIFLSAVDAASPAERHAYLDAACADDAEVRRDVEELLSHYEGLGAFLQSGAMLAAAPQDFPALGEGIGTIIGPYKLLEQIGEGGMGLVFMAEQTQPVRRMVALKILKPGMDTRQVVARFEAERQALAMMDHPNIAKLFDAGTVGQPFQADSASTSQPGKADLRVGRSYFVMELVRGVSITEFCDQHRLTPRQRLELFVTVCQAVQHAHQKGIIHRDLKPSNVLVTLHDTVPVPKVIDFGIAKATGQQLTERTMFTHFAQIIGTPLYMSPEQAEMNGLGIDTRSDVYSLGVMLYELLTGSTPFDSETLKKVGYDEMRRMIREDEPPRPSQRVSTLEAAACTTISARRGVDERGLGQLLRGELDWIVMKTLDKDRNRRYESASALAADVQRYLHDEPVQACPPSAGYRLRKFARRNRRLVGMTCVIALVLLAATAVSAWQAVLARDAQHRAEADRERAMVAERAAGTEAEIAKAINNFLQRDLLRQVDTGLQMDEGFGPKPNLTVKEALDRAAAKIGERFQDQPLIESAIRTAIGDAYRSMGEYKLAVTQLEQAVALRKEHLGPAHRNTLDSVQSLAAAYTDAGLREEALDLHAEALGLFKTTFGSDNPNTCNFIWSYARANHEAGKLEEAERLWRTALDVGRRNNHPGSVNSLAWLSRNLLLQKKYAAAEPLARETLAILEREIPDLWHRFVAMSLLGGALLGQEKYAEAEPLLFQAYEGLRAWEAKLGASWNWRVTEAAERIVDFYEATKQPGKARIWREKLAKEKAGR